MRLSGTQLTCTGWGVINASRAIILTVDQQFNFTTVDGNFYFTTYTL